jgi:transposase, IS30 family
MFLETCWKKGQKVAWIASALNTYRSTVYREIQAGTVRRLNSDMTETKVYNAQRGQAVHDDNGQCKGPGLKIGHDMKLHDFIWQKIKKEHFAPDAVSALLRKERGYSVTLCAKTIYSYIDKRYIRDVDNSTLKEKTWRRKRGKGRKRAEKPAYRPKKSIRERPAEVEDMASGGHLEGDLIVSGRGMSTAALLTLFERKSRYAFMLKIPDKTQKSVEAGLTRLECRIGARRFRELFKTLTLDNGSEFLDWESLERSSVTINIKRIAVYFADPFSSWQRGSNENFNRMVRKFIPKGADIGKYTHKQIKQIEQWINNYPRRILDYSTAREAFEKVIESCQA